jgi:hypothetical protein
MQVAHILIPSRGRVPERDPDEVRPFVSGTTQEQPTNDPPPPLTIGPPGLHID